MFKNDFLHRVISQIMLNNAEVTEKLEKYWKEQVWDNDDIDVNDILKECKYNYEMMPHIRNYVMPYWYSQVGSDQYPYELVNVYEQGKSLIVVLRQMKFDQSYDSEVVTDIRSDYEGNIVVVKKDRKGRWFELGNASYKPQFYMTALPQAYIDPNF